MRGVISEDLIVSCDATPEPRPANANLATALYESLRQRSPEHKQFIDDVTGEVLTSHDLLDQALRLAILLRDRHAVSRPAGDVAMFHSANSLEFVIVELAMIFLGIPISPVTVNCKVLEVTRQRNDCSGTLIFTSADNAPIIKEVVDGTDKSAIKLIVVLDGSHDGFESLDKLMEQASGIEIDGLKSQSLNPVPLSPVNPQHDIHLILYTSGSTGLPKGAALTHAAYLAGPLEMALRLKREAMERMSAAGRPAGMPPSAAQMKPPTFLLAYPLAHTSGQAMFTSFVLMGTTVVLRTERSFQSILSAVDRHRVPSIALSRDLGKYLLDQEEEIDRDYPNLKTSLQNISSSGSALPEWIIRRVMTNYRVTFTNFYGATESGFVTWPTATGIDTYEHGNLGHPTPGTEVRVVAVDNEDLDLDLDVGRGKSLGPGEIGEFWIRSPALFREYINRPDATAAALTPDRWFRSGDLGYVNPVGQLFLVDRLKEMIKYATYSVYPAEVEEVLGTHPAVSESLVVPLPDRDSGEVPLAFVVLSPDWKSANGNRNRNESDMATELEQFTADRLADQKRLRGGVRFVTEIRRIGIGKPDRQYYKKLVADCGHNLADN